MSMSPVVVMDNPPTRHKQLIEGIAAAMPDSSSFNVISVQSLGLYDFKYPHGLTFSRLPFVGEPQWKLRDFGPRGSPTFCYSVQDGCAVPMRVPLHKVLADASEVICACSPDPRGAHAFNTLLAETLGTGVANEPHRVLPLMSLSAQGVSKAFAAKATTQDSAFQALLRRAEAKRFFDYNFNANSLMVFGKALRGVGVEAPSLMSKWMLQVLFWVEADRRHGPFTFGAVLQHMTDWSGWVPHAPKPFPGEVGSASSRHVLIENLLQMGLLEKTGDGANERISVSARGTDFILQIHPDSQDMDLPWRLPAWENTWPESKPKMERYLRTFFGRQNRYRPRN